VERGAAGWDALMQNLELVLGKCTYIAKEFLSEKSLRERRWYPTVANEILAPLTDALTAQK
jgi:hypothetical protein